MRKILLFLTIFLGLRAMAQVAPPAVDNEAACKGASSVILTATGGSAVNTVGLATNVIVPMTGTLTFNGNVSIPAGVTVTSAALKLNGFTTGPGNMMCDFYVGVTGAGNLPDTVLGECDYTVNQDFSFPVTGLTNGTVTMKIYNTWTALGSTSAVITSIELVYTTGSTINWYDAPVDGDLLGTGSTLETVGTSLLPNTNTAGTYTFYAIATDGVSLSTATAATVTIAGISGITLITNVTCNGENTGAINLTPTGGTAPYTFDWGGGITTEDRTNLAAGNYAVIITDSNDCTETVPVNITQPGVLAATAGTQVNVSCNGEADGSATVNVTGGTAPYTYSWAPSGGTAATATGLAPGTYTVTVTDENDCTDTQSFTITQPAVLAATAGTQVNISCNGETDGSATVNVTGGTAPYTYSWSPSGGTAATATGLAAGTYIVTVTDDNDCTTTQNFIITQPAALTATAGTQVNVSCNGEASGSATVNVTGGTGSYIYSWEPSGGTGATASGLEAGTYIVTVTDENECTDTQSFIITQPAALAAAAGTQVNVSCNGEADGEASVNVTGGTAPYTYLWTPSGGTAATATGLTAGTYTVTVTDENDCTATQSFTITQPAALAATAGTQVNISCNGEADGSATVNVTGGTGSYTYLWAPSGGTAATATGLTAGTYIVTVTDENDCTDTQSFTIIQPTALVATAGTQVNISCNGEANGSATVNVTGGTGSYTYSWEPSGGTAATATGLAPGIYTVTVTDENDCTTTQGFTITQPTALELESLQMNVTCNGAANGGVIVNVTGGTGSYTYSWVPSVSTGVMATGLAPGTYDVTVTDENECSITQSFTISQPDVLVATAGTQVDVLCYGEAEGSATVNVTGGTAPYIYSWAPSGGTTATATGLAAGTYTVTVTDDNDCTTTQSFTITQPESFMAGGTQVNISCNGEADGEATVNVTGDPGDYTYSWAPSGGTSATATGLAAGTYTVTVTNAIGCTAMQSFTITQPTITITGTKTNVLCNGESNGTATVTVTGGTGDYTYSWAPAGGTAATATGLEAGMYTVTVTDGNGCTATQSFTITQPTVLTATAGTQVNVSCNGGSSGSATVVVTGGTLPYTYSWAPSGGTAATAAGLAAGTYNVTVTDANGCTAMQSFTITEPEATIITSHPEDATAAPWGEAVFSVVVENAIDYHWYVNSGDGIWELIQPDQWWPSYSGTDTATLTVTDIPEDHNGYSYRVEVLTACGILTSDAALLTVIVTIQGVNDDFSANPVNPDTGGIAGDVTENDLHNGLPVDDEAVIISIVDNDGLTGVMIDADGNLIVPSTSIPGIYVITYTICESNNLTNCSTGEAIVFLGVLGTEDFNRTAVSIYPNPAKDNVYIDCTEILGYGAVHLGIFDINGRLIQEQELSSELETVDISALEDGVYMFNITSGYGTITKQVIRNRD